MRNAEARFLEGAGPQTPGVRGKPPGKGPEEVKRRRVERECGG